MQSCSDYVARAKALLGDPRMSDREFGERLGGYSQTAIASGKHGKMSDPMALRLAELLGIQAGELLMVARLEREKDPAVKAALIAWAGNVFRLMPSRAAQVESVRGGIRQAQRRNSYFPSLSSPRAAARAAHRPGWRQVSPYRSAVRFMAPSDTPAARAACVGHA